MTDITPENRIYFRPGDQVVVGLYLAEMTFVEDAATVICHNEHGMELELCSNGFPSHLAIPAETRAVVTRRESRRMFICNAVLETPTRGRKLRLRLVDKMVISERREYARADVNLQVGYTLPSSQDMGNIIREWEALKRCPGSCFTQPPSRPCRSSCTSSNRREMLTRVNLSGSGLRFKISDCLSYGTLLHLKIALPNHGTGQIHAVGSIIRTRELLPVMEQNSYYSTSMSFKVIDSSDRSRLTEYLLAEQRRALR
jgi:hypothetical protein